MPWYTGYQNATYKQSYVSLEVHHELCFLKMSVPTMAQYTSCQYVNMFSGRSATNSLPTKYVKTNFTIIYKLWRFSESYITNSVLTEDGTTCTVTSNTPPKPLTRWNVFRETNVEWRVGALPRNWDYPKNYSCGFLDQYRVVNSRVTPSWPDDCWPQLAKLRRRHLPFHSFILKLVSSERFRGFDSFLGYLTTIYNCSG